MADAANVQVAAGADPASLATLTNSLSAAITTGFEKGFGDLKGMFAQVASGPLKQLNTEMSKTFGNVAGIDKTEKAIKNLGGTLTLSAKDSLAFVASYKEIAGALTGLTAVVNKQSAEIKTAATTQNSSVISASNERVQALRNEGKISQAEIRAQGDIALRETKTSGQQRVQITRQILDTIGRLEKGLGATLSGIAKTSVGAVSKVFDGLKSVVTRSDREVFSSSTFTNSLKERERELQSSFSRQTNTIRESVTRQETALISLRETTQRGVLGQVSNASLIGGLGAGFAAFAALKSTFTIGADFSRGLAVLQASLDLTDAEMKKVRATSIALGNDISLPGVSALDAAQAIQTLSKQFGSLGPAAVGAAQAAAKGTLQLARAAGAGADDAAALIGSSVNVFKVSADDAVFAADAITGALTRAAGVGFSDFKDSFIQGATVFEQFVGPAESAKDTLLDFNTTLAILAKNGITGSNAGAGLKQFFLQATQDTKSASKASIELTKRAGQTGNVFFDSSHKARSFSDSIEILRKGVVGLNDETKNQTLGDLFGSRSITVANALINSTGISFKALRDQIAQQGLAAKIAAAQNTGLKGALDALTSVAETVQIILFEKVNKPLGAAVLAITTFANTILFSATPAMHELRIALLGVAAGLGGLLALKTGAEVLALLGKTAALVFTPVGALVALFAVVGAGIALFADNSKGFSDQLLHVRDNVVGFGQDLLAKVQPTIQTVSTFIQQTAIPTAIRWASTVARDLKGAFEATVNFVQDTVIPGFQRFIAVLETEVFPRVASVAEIVVNAVVTAKNAVVGFATAVSDVVGPLIAPAIKGFQDLGSAIASFFTGGGLSALGSGFAAAGIGIGGAFANIGVTVFNALKPVGITVFNFFKELFSVRNLIGAVNGIGDFLNFIGEKLAQIVTNPKVIAAIGIVAAVAAKLAFDLVTGLAQGILDNIPQLLKDAGSLIVDNLINPEAITIALVGALAVLSLTRISGAFKALGAGGAAGFAEGFKTKLSGTGDFLGGLLGGAGRAQSSAGTALFGSVTQQAQDLQNKLRALGSTTVVSASNPFGLKDAEKELAQLKLGLNDSQIAGLEFRDKLKSIGSAVGGIFSGGGQIVSGLAQVPLAFANAGRDAIAAFRNSAVAARSGNATFVVDSLGGTTAIKDSGTSVARTLGESLRSGLTAAKDTVVGGFNSIFGAVRTAAAEQGLTAGQALGKGLKTAAIAAVAIGGGLAAGQALGNAQNRGDQIQAIGALAATSLAIGAINPVAGIATAGIGLLTAAFTGSSDAAKAYKEDVDKIASELSPKLVEAVKAGKLALDDLRDGLTFRDIDKAGVSNAVTSIVDALDDQSLSTLQKFGQISFADAFKGIIDSGAPVKDVATQIREQLLNLITRSDEFRTKFGDNAAKAAASLAAISKPGGDANFGDLTPGEQVDLGLSDAQEAAFKSILGVINDTTAAVDKNGAALKASTDKTLAYGSAIAGIDPAGILAIGSTSAARAIIDSGDALDKSSIAIERAGSAFKNVIPPAVATNIENVKTALAGVSSQFKAGVIPAGTASGTTPAEEVAAALQNIVDIKTNINNAFAEGILPPGVSTSQDALDQAIIGVSGVGEALRKTITDKTSGAISEALAGAQINASLKTASEQASAVIQKGVAEGIVIDDATAAAAIAPLKKEILDSLGADNPLLAAQVEATFGNIVAKVSAAVDDAQTATAAQNIATVAQSILDGTPISVASTAGALNIPDGWAVQAVGAANAQLAETPITVPTPVLPDIFVPVGFDQTAIDAAAVGGSSIGSAVATGMSSGIAGGKSGVVNAATQIARDAIQAARVALSISSPSKVFREIGSFITQGLSAGIIAGGDDVVQNITDLVARAVDAATGAANTASKALRSGSSDLFTALFGSGSAVGRGDFGGLQGQISQSFNSLAGALDDSFNKAADVLKRSATEALSRSDLDILGESPGSLNPLDVLGASNRAALAATLDQIAALGKEMIDTGVNTDQVAKTLQGYVDHTRQLAIQYGVNAVEVDAVIGALGLSGDALTGFVRTNFRLASALGQVTTSASKLNDTAVELFKNMTDGAGAFRTLNGVGAAEDARAKVTSSLSTIAAAADANDQKAKAILDSIAQGNALSLADQLAFNQGLNGRQINFSDQFGVANRTAFEQAIDSIRALGEALVAGGSSIDYVNQQINENVLALEQYGASLGFNAQQIQDLVDQAGLGSASLAAFNQSVADAATLAAQADAAQSQINQNTLAGLPNAGGFPASSNQFTAPTDGTAAATGSGEPMFLFRDFNQTLSVPYGDPQAIALATANGVAQAVRLPGS